MLPTKLINPLLSYALAIGQLSACATTHTLSSKPIEGVVREDVTNQPIPGAIVIARWQGHLGYTGTICYHVEIAMTDTQGRYRIPAWNKTSPYGDIAQQRSIVKAYKPGYQLAKRYPVNNPLLKSFSGEREERLKYLLHLSGLIGCYDAGDEKLLVPVFKALYEEAKVIATSENDKGTLQTIRRRALYAWSRPTRELTTSEIEQAIENDPYLREQFQ